MKTFNILIVIFLTIATNALVAQKIVAYEKFGASFEKSDTIDSNVKVYENLKVADTTLTQITGKIKEVCRS